MGSDEAARWIVCPTCSGLIYARRLARNLGVCPVCGHHARISPSQRLEQLLDPGSAQQLDLSYVLDDIPLDPLAFVDSRAYPDRLHAARRKSGLDEAVVCLRATIDDHPLIIAAMDFAFLGGSLGCAVGELITAAGEVALDERLPFLIITASGGARMQEGALSLMQMAKTSQLLADLDAAGLLTISLITDPTFGGVAASFATLCDVLIAEPGARLGFAGARVVLQTIRQELPVGFQTAEFLLEHGLIDLIRPRQELRAALAKLLAVGAPAAQPPVKRPRGATLAPDAVVRDPGELSARDAWDAVRAARDLGRPSFADLTGRLLDEWIELSGDRIGGDCSAIRGGLGTIAGRPVVMIGHQKGHTITALNESNFGMASPEGHRKAARLMRLAGKLGLPVLAFIDTPGAYPGITAEERGQAVSIAENLRLLATLPVPVISIVTGEGGSGGALALGVADDLLLCENAVLSVISPEGCAAILFGDSSRAPEAARSLRIQPRDLLELGVIDGVIREPDGGSQHDPLQAIDRIRAAVVSSLNRLQALPPEERLARRHARLRNLGTTRSAPSRFAPVSTLGVAL